MPMSLTRLDVREWVAHRECPAAVDASKDRRARWYFAFSEGTTWVMLPFLVLFVVPSLNGVPTLHPLVLIVFTVGMTIAATVAVFRFRALRKVTGAPILADSHNMIEATAEVFNYQKTCFREALETPGLDRAARAALRKDEADWSKIMWRLRRTLLRQCELAAFADRRGWTRMRDRQLRKITEMCSAVCGGFLQRQAEAGRASGSPD